MIITSGLTKKKTKKFYLSSTGYDTLEDCLEQVRKWKEQDSYKGTTTIIEAKKIYHIVEKLEALEV